MFVKLDYCNSLLFGITQNKIRRLQVAQNHAVRLIFRKSRRESVSALLSELHWLNVEKRIEFKAVVLVYRCLEGSAPTYLKDLLKRYEPSRNLRSSTDKTKLIVPTCKTKASERAFSFYGPKLWNALPQRVREAKSLDIFKTNLKTHLFCRPD